jgi:diaminopimelate decarboxylase
MEYYRFFRQFIHASRELKTPDLPVHADNRPLIADRPPAFVYSSGELCCEQVPLSRLTDEFGTPLYIYSGNTILGNYRTFDAAFTVPHTVCYSVKANSNLSILKMLAGVGAGFDIVSGGELERVVRAAPQSVSRVVFSGVGKTAAEMDAALRAGILVFNLESESEMALLAARAEALGVRAPVAFRVNPDVSADTHPYISTGLHKHKFGVPIGEALRLYRRAREYRSLNVAGVSAHIGSQIREFSPFNEAATLIASLIRDLRNDSFDIRYVDAGGGLGIPYQPHQTPDFAADAAAYVKALTAPVSGLDLHLLLEPGRSIVASAGALITRVIYRKQNNGKRFVIVDAAMNDLIRPSLYGAHHQIIPVRNGSAAISPCDIVGPVCESGDFFAREREMLEVAEGDLLAILDAGAYGMSLASNYNTRMRPPEVLVEGESVKLIRRRERIEDLLAAETEV